MQALKEWSAIVSALETGDQIITLRKGGIQDVASGFKFTNKTFALFPTHEHQDASSIKPSFRKHLKTKFEHDESFNTISSLATVIAEADIRSMKILKRLSSMHIWSESFIEKRIAWMPQRPMRVALLQINTTERIKIPIGEEHTGCKSWVDVDYNPTQIIPIIDDKRAKDAKLEFKEAISV